MRSYEHADGHRVDRHVPVPRSEDQRLPVACLLERWIGRPSSEWQIDDLVGVFRDRDLKLLCLMHVGGDGLLKTLDFVPRSLSHLRDVLIGGERADGSSLFPGLGIPAGASDVVLRPRPTTAFLDPFSPMPTLAVLCGHAGRDMKPLPQSPDTIVYRAFERLQDETGITLHALGEVEHFLGGTSAPRDAYGTRDRGYHATGPFVFGESLRRRAISALAEMGIPVKYGHSEVGYVEAGESDGVIWEQHEIELGLAPLPRAADAVVLTQWVLRKLAHADNLRVNFDPILKKGHVGTGLHFHFSPVIRDENQLVHLADGGLSDSARWIIAGLVRNGTAMMAFGNRVDGSFVRLSQAMEAPRGVVWGSFNRSALVRIPMVPRDAEGRPVTAPTVEFRLPDGSAHPHLLLAGIAQAMVDGHSVSDLDTLLAGSEAKGREGDSAAGSGLPKSFAEVATALRASRGVLEGGDVFPGSLLDRVIAQLEETTVP